VKDWIGWTATAVFAASYFSKTPAGLRWIQALAAMLWISYGVATGAAPVVVANVVVALMAVVSMARKRRDQES
jgi:hypothetical protein